MTDERSPAPESLEMAAALRGYISQKGVTQQQLAEKVGYSPAYLSMRMSGKKAMTTDLIAAAAALTGVTYREMVDILMSRITDPPDPLDRILAAGRETAKNNATAKKKAAEAKPKTTRRKRRA